MDSTQPFEVLEPTLHRWYADSFLFVENGRKYIFVEIMDDANGEKGTIGVIDLQDNKGFVEIINEPFHMSFPNVFKLKNDIYMMPETSESNQLQLYKAVDFPYKWKRHAVLFDDIAVVDTVCVKTEVMDYYSAADIFILPSLYEGLPVVGIEAQVAALPVLLADTITTETQISDSVRFLPITDAKLWAENIAELRNCDRETITRSLNLLDYKIENQAEKLKNLYLELLKKYK